MKSVLLTFWTATVCCGVELSPAIQELIASGRFVEARAQCSDVVSRDPLDVEHRTCIARMDAWLGHYKDSLANYDEALALSPDNADALTGKALVLIWRKRLDAAETILRQVRSSAQPNAEIEMAYAQLERERGHRGLAQDYVRRALALDPSSKDALAMLRADEEIAPVVVRFGAARDYYSFTSPGTLESTSVEYLGAKSTFSLNLQRGTRFGDKATRGGAGYLIRFQNRWTAHVDALIGSRSDVYPALDIKAGLAARLGSHWVAGFEYRRLSFLREGVDVAGPEIEYYWKSHPVWAQIGVGESRAQFQQESASGHSWYMSAQITSQLNRRLLTRVGFATGDENYINWNVGQIGYSHEKLASGSVEYRICRRYTAGLAYAFAERSNNLTQQTLAVSFIVRP